MIVTSSRRAEFARRARNDPRIISALPGLVLSALICSFP
jgi:ABC-type sulfate transport system permease subunit